VAAGDAPVALGRSSPCRVPQQDSVAEIGARLRGTIRGIIGNPPTHRIAPPGASHATNRRSWRASFRRLRRSRRNRRRVAASRASTGRTPTDLDHLSRECAVRFARALHGDALAGGDVATRYPIFRAVKDRIRATSSQNKCFSCFT